MTQTLQPRTSVAISELRTKFGSAEKLMMVYNPSTQTSFCRDAERVHAGNAPSISLVGMAYGNSIAESWMEIQLNDLSEFAGCKDKMRTSQIAELARMMIGKYPHLKLTEFMLFFQRFKRCEYGKFYGAVDPMAIMQALAVFDEQRHLALEKKRAREQRERIDADRRESELLRQRYANRVPGAYTEKAPMDFSQYRLLGYDRMSDDDLQKEIADLQSGKKEIPKDAKEMVEYIEQVFRNK